MTDAEKRANATYYQRHKKRLNEKQKRWRRTHPEARKAQRARWRAKHRETIRSYQQRYAEKYPERIKERHRRQWEAVRWKRFEKKYGITRGVYERLLNQQENVCPICERTPTGSRYDKFCIDHDHTTGRVRGLLCRNCNVGLGLIGDTLVRVGNLLDYLQMAPH